MRTRTRQNRGSAVGTPGDQEFALAVAALKRDSDQRGSEENAFPPRLVFAYNPKRDIIASMGEDHGFLDHISPKAAKTLVIGMLVGSPKFIPESADSADGFVAFNLDALNNSNPDDVVRAAQHIERFMSPEKPLSLQGDRTWQIRKRCGERLPQTLGELARGETELSD